MAKGNGGTVANKIRIDELVSQYLKIRERVKEIEKEHEDQLRPFKEVQEKLSMRLLAFLDATGQESARTAEGTVYKSVRHNPSLTDPEEFMDFVFKNNLPELLNRHANGTACIQYAHEHGSLPPGVVINSIRSARVRTAT